MSTTETRLTRRLRRAGARSGIRWYLVRRWAYGVAVAALPVLVYFRVLQPEALPVLAPLLLALFNTRPPAAAADDTAP